MSLASRIKGQIKKHEEMIVVKEGGLEKVKFGKFLADTCLVGEKYDCKYDCRVGECNAYIDHSKYMIRLFTEYLADDAPKIKKMKLSIIYKLIRDNAVVLEEHLSECVKHGLYTEGLYLDQMNKFQVEVNSWDRLVQSL